MTSEKSIRYNPDRAAMCIHNAILQDFRRVQGESFCKSWTLNKLDDVPAFRALEIPELGEIPVYRLKAYMQVKSLLKRHTFHCDALTKEELLRKSHKDFFDNQLVLASPRHRTHRSFLVLQEARRIAKSLLGKPDMSAIAMRMKHGKRSVMGVPLAQALLDKKLGDSAAARMSRPLLAWFENYVNNCPLTRSAVGYPAELQLVDHLDLSTVPKSWKILRFITPLPVWSLFYSFGVAGVVTDALKSVGIDISKQQERHRRWARAFSRTRSHVTADLSKASDSITLPLLNAVLPREWYVLLRPMLATHISCGWETYHMMSVLPMGNGATFPIETLIFYCLIRAIGNLLKKVGLFSVYGDDLIYPRSIHTHVAQIFGELGIKMNMDKTFCSSFFRESCGGDYYHGIDVRPALLPECDRADFTKTEYKAWLYKSYNALQRRWSMEHELPETKKWILMELSSLSRWLFQVPPSYPDHCGIKSEFIRTEWYWNWFIPVYNIPKEYRKGQLPAIPPEADVHRTRVRVWSFKALDFSKDKIQVSNELPYLWDRLRSSKISTHRRSPFVFWKNWMDYHFFDDSETIESVRVCDSRGKPVVDKRGRQRFLRCVTSPAQDSGRFSTNTFSISYWE